MERLAPQYVMFIGMSPTSKFSETSSKLLSVNVLKPPYLNAIRVRPSYFDRRKGDGPRMQIAVKNLVGICLPNTSSKRTFIFSCNPPARHQHLLFMNQNTWLLSADHPRALLSRPASARAATPDLSRHSTTGPDLSRHSAATPDHLFPWNFLKGFRGRNLSRFLRFPPSKSISCARVGEVPLAVDYCASSIGLL
jgi:hypothetical protein